MNRKKLGFVGLGVMGFPMAGHLAKAGHEVSVFNRSPEKSIRWAETFPGRAGETIAEAVAEAEMVFLCVGRDDDVRGVVAQALPEMAPGGIIIDHTTTSAKLAIDMAKAAALVGRAFVDAPVSGGQAGAESGQLTVMCGGEPEAFARAEQVINAFAKAVRRLGGPGSGQLAKMVNQIAIAGVGNRRRLRCCFEGSCPVLADGQSLGDYGGRQIRVRLCCGLDAQGPRTCFRRGQVQWGSTGPDPAC